MKHFLDFFLIPFIMIANIMSSHVLIAFFKCYCCRYSSIFIEIMFIEIIILKNGQDNQQRFN